MNKQPEALRLAECLNDHEYCSFVQMDDAASELRRLHEENDELRRLHVLNGESLGALELSLERLVERCNADMSLCNDDAVIAAEATLERIYRARAAIIIKATGE